tara:strand:+ start:57 stop:581 length:525 start_codon:yes stop_codon:yes gene_type:complete
MKNFNTLITLALMTIFLSGCSLWPGSDDSSSYQEESRKIISYLLADMPLPDEAEIQKTPTVILGTGAGIAGRIVLTSNVSPATNLIFFSDATLGTGWSLISSTVAEEIVLIYTKDGRYATIEIVKTSESSGWFGSESNSQINISVVHPSAIQQQNPYMSLKPASAADSFVVQGD